ncbi:hypothetical protein QAD02_005427 [Eretmocerus hayati]|uniref:Uncharacterized protein n=1 Tax=Eretmocerus hayati TaxID=131215 RepID=A0ACC2NSI2_9HYME|nr:hypothetical protein QAD02_005427 [Eretmocerus hayati]
MGSSSKDFLRSLTEGGDPRSDNDPEDLLPGLPQGLNSILMPIILEPGLSYSYKADVNVVRDFVLREFKNPNVLYNWVHAMIEFMYDEKVARKNVSRLCEKNKARVALFRAGVHPWPSILSHH